MNYQNFSQLGRHLFWIKHMTYVYECQYSCKQRPKKRKYRYDIHVDTGRTIKYVEFSYCKDKHCRCTRNKSKVWLLVNGQRTNDKYLCHCPCRWYLNKKVIDLKLVSTRRLNCECMNINVVYQKSLPRWFKPGEKYNIKLDSCKIIKTITVLWEDRGSGAMGELFFKEGEYTFSLGKKNVPDTPSEDSWLDIYYPASIYTEALIGISGACAHIFSANVVYEEEPWIPIEPGQTILLPPKMPEISTATFEVKTDRGSSSKIALLVEDNVEFSRSVTFPPFYVYGHFESPKQSINMSLKNVGDKIVYFRNLRTE